MEVVDQRAANALKTGMLLKMPTAWMAVQRPAVVAVLLVQDEALVQVLLVVEQVPASAQACIDNHVIC